MVCQFFAFGGQGALLKNARRAPLDPPKNFLLNKSFVGVQGARLAFFKRAPWPPEA